MGRRLRIVHLLTAAVVLSAAPMSAAQTPQAPAAPRPPETPATQAAPADGRPSEAELGGLPVYPSAVFLRAYDAGRGQHYYVYGTTVPFAEMVSYYKNILKEKGSLVFDVPPTHVFEIGKFRDEIMAFPPSVTVKDYTFSGSAGFPNPRPGGQPERFPTLIQIVPAPAAAPPR